MKYLSLLPVVLLLAGCTLKFETRQETKATPAPMADGIVTDRYANGKVRSEIPMKGGKKNGRAKQYYENGKLSLEIDYVDNKRHGELKRYYETGTLYKEAQYANDKQTCIEKEYRSDGKLASEMPYNDDSPCMGLKEYLTDGSPRKKFPGIVIKPINNLLKSDEYILEVSMSDGSKNVEYYEGILTDGCIDRYMEKLRSGTRKGVGEIRYQIRRGGFLMEKVNIVAKVKTLQGNYYITQKEYNVAIENR